MNDIYSPLTGEHIATDNPAEWMRHSGIAAPAYDSKTHGCFWRGDFWEVVSATPQVDIDEERERAKSEIQPLRDLFLNRLSGIAVFTDLNEVKEECATLRSELLDITKDEEYIAAETYGAMRLALLARYRLIAAGASEEIRAVFRELDA